MENTQKVPIVVPKVAFLSTFGTTIELFCILKVDDAYQLQENAAIQQIIDNKYLKSFKADKLKVIDQFTALLDNVGLQRKLSYSIIKVVLDNILRSLFRMATG